MTAQITLGPRSDLELAGPLRAIIDAGGMRYLRMRHPALTLGDVSSGAGLAMSRVVDLEGRRGERVSDSELVKLHRLFHKHGLR